MSQLLELLSQLQVLSPERCQLRGAFAEITPSESRNFYIHGSGHWTPNWDKLQGQIQRWAVADGLVPLVVWNADDCHWRAGIYASNGIALLSEADSAEPAIALLSAYLKAKKALKGAAA